jgi:ADP-heptose:LPS heptosyltransferase
MKILCICPIGIGNYLLMYPACLALKKKRPETNLHLLALRQAIRDLAEGDPLWSGITMIDPTRDPSLAKQAAFIRQLWREHYDASLSFFPSNTWQYNLLPYISGVSTRYAFKYPLKQGASLSFLNTRQTPVDPKAHDVNQNFRLVSAFTGKDTGGEPVTFPALRGGFQAVGPDALWRTCRKDLRRAWSAGAHFWGKRRRKNQTRDSLDGQGALP